MDKYPYFDLSLIEANQFYTRRKASVILDIDPDVFDTVIFANVSAYADTDATTRIFTGAEIIHAITKYYLPFLKQALVDDASELNQLAFRAKYGIGPEQVTAVLTDTTLLNDLFKRVLVEDYYPVPKGERKRR